jgi:hypothetical protein
VAQQERAQHRQQTKLSKHTDSIPLQKINYFPGRRAPPN